MFLGVKGGRPGRKAENLTGACEPTVLENVGASAACYRDSFTFNLAAKQNTEVHSTAAVRGWGRLHLRVRYCSPPVLQRGGRVFTFQGNGRNFGC
jgi:hypothetical protein